MLLSDVPSAWLLALATALGLLFGSFLNVVIHRVPRGENIAFPASRCPHCGTNIRAYDNIPVVSWLLLRGRARCCGAPIARRYPLVEAMGGGFGFAIQYSLLQSPGALSLEAGMGLFAAYLALCLGLLAALFIDLEFMLLPDSITLGGALLGFATTGLRDRDWSSALVGGAVGFLIVYLPFDRLYRLLRGQPGMGLGDAKLLLLAGTWFGWEGAVFSLLAGAIQGTIGAVALYAAQGRIEEPEAVRAERAAWKEHLETLDEAERAQLERELDGDILTNEPDSSFGKARIAFGPFLILAIYEYLFFESWIRERFVEVFWLG